jgi:hypothetical protein
MLLKAIHLPTCELQIFDETFVKAAAAIDIPNELLDQFERDFN